MNIIKLLVMTLALVAIFTTCSYASETVWLTSLDLGRIKQGWGKPQVDKSVTETPLSIAGQKFERGLGTHSLMTLHVRLDGKTSRFQAKVGLDDNANSPTGCIMFKVTGDDRLLWTSPLMRMGDKALDVDVDLRGIKMLQLEVEDAGNGIAYDHANWADARFTIAGAVPKAVSIVQTDPVLTMEGRSASEMATPEKLPYEKVLPGKITDYQILTAQGHWGKEYLLQHKRLTEYGFNFIQTAGRSCTAMKPWLMACNLKTGQGIAVSLAYSGNWSLSITQQNGKPVLRASASPSNLKPFRTVNGMPIPGALVSEFTGHWDNGAQPITRFIRSKLLRDMGDDWPPVQYNTWYADSANITEEVLLKSAKVAAELGCELFTVDAGWYGNHDNWSVLGDWDVNRKKFPNGLEPVIQEVRKLGMKFGLWVEIENVTPDSPLGKEHPDWFLKDADRMLNNRATLDFGNPEALAWARSIIDKLMTDYQLDYIKMDYNCDPAVDSEKYAGKEDPLYGHYRGLADLWKYMRSKYPKLIVENCASGSLRQDLMTAALTDTHWVSDNIGNDYNLPAVFCATYFFPPEICNHWTVHPTKQNEALDLPSQFAVNMMGHLGLSGKIWEWDEETRKVAAEQIALYKQIRPIIRSADVYHLTPQADPSHPESIQASLYVDSRTNKALLFAFQGGDPKLETTLKLRGLKADVRYRVTGYEKPFTGYELMKKGLPVRFGHKGTSVIVHLELSSI